MRGETEAEQDECDQWTDAPLALIAWFGDDFATFAMILFGADLIVNIGIGQLVQTLALGAAELKRSARRGFVNPGADGLALLTRPGFGLKLFAGSFASGGGAFAIKTVRLFLCLIFQFLFFGPTFFSFAFLLLD